LLRVGVTPLSLTPASDTPFLGERVDEAVAAYNAAADAYNQAHGFPDGSDMATSPIERGALGVRSTLLVIAPALEVGHPNAFLRFERSSASATRTAATASRSTVQPRGAATPRDDRAVPLGGRQPELARRPRGRR